MRLVFDVNDGILFSGYVASKDLGDMPFAEYKESVSGFVKWGIMNGSLPAGIILFDGNCAHIAIVKEYQGQCGFVIRKALRRALKEHGSLIGMVLERDRDAIRFNERLGFKRIGHMQNVIIFHRSE